MATRYTFNIDSPFLQSPLPKPGDRTSSNPFGLSFGSLPSNALKQFNLSKVLLNGISTIGKGMGAIGKTLFKGYEAVGKPLFKGYGAIGEFIPTKQGAENGTEQVATLAIDTLGKGISKTPIGAAWYTTYKLGSLFGLNGTATDFNDKENGLTFAENLGNALTKPIPFIGALGTSVEKNDRSRLAGSHMYSWEGNIDKYGQVGNGSNKFNVLFGGSKIAEGGRKDKININTAVGIRDLGNRDILGAADVFKELQKLNSQIQGGWDYINPDSRIYAKQGSILQFGKRALSKDKIVKLLSGGSIKHRTLDELVDYVEQKNPPFWERMSGQDKNEIPSPFGDGGYSTLIMGWSTGDNGMAEVYPHVQYDNTTHHLKYIQDWREALDLARKNGDIVIMTPEEAENFTTNYKKASKLKHIYDSILPLYTETFTGIFKEGGKVNVIPEGALHKNKHHLEDVNEKFGDGSITTKGIPVIVESEGGEVIQQAEVEREEIIFRLEVTKKLEELRKKHTDEAAIEAGKLLVKEILYNTEDNTGEML